MFRRLSDLWLARTAHPTQAALQAVAHLKPAVVVTGASRGIGLALARRFAKAGHDIALLAREPGPLVEAATAIAQDFHVKALAVAIDVTAPDAPRTIDARMAEHGYFADILNNNAGVGLAARFKLHGPSKLTHLLNLNVVALTRLMRHVLPGMLARARGGVLNVASLGGLTPGPYQAAYYASKAYVISLSEAVGYETAGSGVRISVLAPGPVDTGFHEAIGTGLSFYRQLLVPLSPEQTANAAYRGYMLGCRLIVPGFLNKGLTVALRILPHTLLLPITAWLLRPRKEQPWGDTTDGKG